MRNSSSFVRIVVSIAVFVLLETISILLITNNGIVQRYRIVGGVRSIQTSLWRFGENTKAYFNLKETNKYLWGNRLDEYSNEEPPVIED